MRKRENSIAQKTDAPSPKWGLARNLLVGINAIIGILLLLHNLNIIKIYFLFPHWTFWINRSEPPGVLPILSSIAGLILIIRSIFWNIWTGKHLSKQARFPNQTLLKDHEFIKTGPYTKVRHPFYATEILIFFGWLFIVFWWPYFFICTLISFIDYKISVDEEKLMIENFGDAYMKYRKSTRMLF